MSENSETPAGKAGKVSPCGKRAVFAHYTIELRKGGEGKS